MLKGRLSHESKTNITGMAVAWARKVLRITVIETAKVKSV